MAPKLLGIAFARNPDHQAEVTTAPACTPAMASSITTARAGATCSIDAAVRNVSGAGFPARCRVWITLPSTLASKKASSPAAFRTASQFDSR